MLNELLGGLGSMEDMPQYIHVSPRSTLKSSSIQGDFG